MNNPEFPLKLLYQLLKARPEWMWRFSLRKNECRGDVLQVYAYYVCPCAAQEVLNARQEFDEVQILDMTAQPELLEHFVSSFFRAHDANIEEHTAKWSRVAYEEITFGAELSRYNQGSYFGPRVVCARCRRGIGDYAWRRDHGVLPPDKLPTSEPPRYYCSECGSKIQAEEKR